MRRNFMMRSMVANVMGAVGLMTISNEINRGVEFLSETPTRNRKRKNPFKATRGAARRRRLRDIQFESRRRNWN